MAFYLGVCIGIVIGMVIAAMLSRSGVDDVEDAQRYRWLRERDIETVHRGGVFAGMTPQNYVLNGDDLDTEIDAARVIDKALEERYGKRI